MTDLSDHPENNLTGRLAFVHIIGAGVSTPKTFSLGDKTVEFSDLDRGLRWIHLPENDLPLVQVCFAKCDPNYVMDPRISQFSNRPILSQYVKTPSHAKHLKPSCTKGNLLHATVPSTSTIEPTGDRSGSDGIRPEADETRTRSHVTPPKESWLPPLSVYLPYMSRTKYEHYCSLREEYMRSETDQKDSPLSKLAKRYSFKISTSSSRKQLHKKLGISDPLRSDCHPRRTLDQFYYPALSDTSGTDQDQTISKWSGKDLPDDGREKAVNDSLLLMVDQLWCWVVDDKTVISCFPRAGEHCPNHGTLYESIKGQAHTCNNVWDIQSLIVKHAIGYLFSQQNIEVCDIVEIYRWVTSIKAADQTVSFQQFHQRYANGEYNIKTFDDRGDMKIMLEVADIIDELKMIRHVLQTQKDILLQMTSALAQFEISNMRASDTEDVQSIRARAKDMTGLTKTHILAAADTLALVLTEIAGINEDAQATHKTALDLLDLKSKMASLAEARATTKQGQAVMLFTVVTIVFLPLSFFTSYFGQNVSEMTGDSKNPTSWQLWRTATPISVVVIVLALLVAFYITVPDSKLWFWQTPYRYVRKELHEYNTKRRAATREASAA